MSAYATAVVLIAAAVVVIFALALALRARAELRVHQARFVHTREDLDLARADSLARSRQTVSGKVQEHLALYIPGLVDRWNPRDARFLGSPVDFVVFDGLDQGGEVTVTFVEVKTGRSSLSARERKVRDAVRQGRVGWELVRLDTGTLANQTGEALEAADP